MTLRTDRRRAYLFCAFVTSTALGGCVVRTRPVGYVSTTYSTEVASEVYVNHPPPERVVEYQSPPPGPGYLWMEGYWDWTGYDWYWVSGSWAPPRAGYIYVAPRYVFLDGRWV